MMQICKQIVSSELACEYLMEKRSRFYNKKHLLTHLLFHIIHKSNLMHLEITFSTSALQVDKSVKWVDQGHSERGRPKFCESYESTEAIRQLHSEWGIYSSWISVWCWFSKLRLEILPLKNTVLPFWDNLKHGGSPKLNWRGHLMSCKVFCPIPFSF